MYYATVSLRKKSTGEFIKARMFPNSNNLYNLFDAISDGQYVYMGFGTKAPKYIQVIKMDIPNLNVIAVNGHYLT